MRAEPRGARSPADRTMDVPREPPRGPRRGVRESGEAIKLVSGSLHTFVVCFIFYAHSNTFNYETMLAQSACMKLPYATTRAWTRKTFTLKISLLSKHRALVTTVLPA